MLDFAEQQTKALEALRNFAFIVLLVGSVGLLVWVIGYLFPNAGFAVIGFLSMQFVTIATVWGLVEILVAALAGAALYKEAA